MSPGTSAFQCRGRVGAGEAQLAHMRDVEQPGLGAGVQMLGEDAGGILHRHLVAGERHHPGAERLVERVERRPLERRRKVIRGHPYLRQSGRQAPGDAPSVVDPERFTVPPVLALPGRGGERVGAGLLLR